MFFLGLGLAFIFRENIAGPIRRLTGAAEQVGAGDLTVRATVESGDEIGTLAETFNQMTGQLGQTLEDLEQRRNDLQVAAETLRGQNEYLSALHDTSLGLLDRLDLNELLETLVIRAGQLLESPYGYIYLVEPGATSLELKVVVGISEQQLGDRMQPGEGLAGKVWQTGQPVVGVLGLGYATDSDRAFGDNEVELLSRFAQLASITLDNARLYSEVQEARVLAESTNKELSQTLKDLRTTQNQLVEAEKMAALGQLVAGVAHEINTPVGVGVTAASALEDKTLAFLDIYKSGQMKRSDLEKYLNMAEQSSSMILRNLSRAAELIQSFKQVAVDQSTEERRTFTVKPYLEEVLLSLHPQLKKTQHTIEIEGNDDITLESYPGAFSQIATNFVMNSLVHAYEPDDEGYLTFPLKREDGRLIFEYTDDGKGISEENLSKIFDPFFTTKRGQGGSGLGLHIIYNLVTQKMGGTIRCESQVGVGTRFVIELSVT